MKFILFKKKKKSKTYPVRCACSVPEQNKKNPKFFWIAEGRDRESKRERENPKAESLKRWNPCFEVRRPPPVTARPSLTAPLTPADCCCRRRRYSVTPRAVRLSGSALRSGMFLFCFFFLFLSFFSGSATSLLLTALPSCLLFCYLVVY